VDAKEFLGCFQIRRNTGWFENPERGRMEYLRAAHVVRRRAVGPSSSGGIERVPESIAPPAASFRQLTMV
jgi:hypothetical protein